MSAEQPDAQPQGTGTESLPPVLPDILPEDSPESLAVAPCALAESPEADLPLPDSGTKPRSRLHLDRTLSELESALNDWDSLSSSTPTAAPSSVAAPGKPAEETDFKKRTKHLLDELRRQLADL